MFIACNRIPVNHFDSYIPGIFSQGLSMILLYISRKKLS